ncbi:4-hydroxy-3-methylbut-2-enyl diphosphate reductase [Pseudoalteromonas luteoviolacea]|uniref:4-hydroxy-3-methylbut-2-enyl diphosphate reductase n=1 Tax=Pseudoalteromonas luteoviolacea (strain 2ta16) TaxID=1353533 RepID=V4JFR9_PSEL2|nr:4-hydroxy-3-methylbut-2-enyl diphosphate reductase [Pseudoalteromonas luteoviolacea]ESP93807.1 (E)-4-hydroxy-3-methyl-but-2-enyl pyrophosphate reductase (IPP and DMAPP forming) [Pseudoalteromonas luteoviolacea 2ta16]KZN31240.1 4-hydroxy-3-methylbut-2-enyl diphosphate reductase [Pseudoalteromonas luteoviolacea NCIMB 1944]
MEILLANPRGFCAGVDRAISIVERALDIFEKPIYVRHEVVHNKYVVNGLKDRGAVFVEELHQVPDDSIVIFSAHGVSQQVRQEAKRRELKVFDATCPLVTKVHMEVTRASRKGTECILIGHNGHPEVEGTMGQYDNPQGGIYLVETPEDVASLEVKDASNLFYCSQTTLSVDDTADVIEALRIKFPKIHGPRKDDICYATQNRQDAVRDLADKVDLLLVVGAKNSSNSNRLRELADKMGTAAHLIDDEKSISSNWFENVERVGVTAGASAPEVLVQQVISRLKQLGGETVVENPGQEENVVFAVPVELR